jgi:hypothetical protein
LHRRVIPDILAPKDRKNMTATKTHLIKLNVGAESVDDVYRWQDDIRAAAKRDNVPFKHRHVTRMWPKRAELLLNGGSLYWVIKGFVQAHQRIIALDEVIGEDGIRRCGIVLNPEIHLTTVVKKRPFQGWRYLSPEDAPPDLHKASRPTQSVPTHLAAALADIGVR